MQRMDFNLGAAVLAAFILGDASASAETTAELSLTRFDCGKTSTGSAPAPTAPQTNTSRAETLASLDRFKQLAKNLNATVIIQHDARDIEKLPAFPASAK